MKVYELAKKLSVESKKLINELSAMDIAVKSHLSVLDDKVVKKVSKSLKNKKDKGEASAKRISTKKVTRKTSTIIKKEKEKKKSPVKGEKSTTVDKKDKPAPVRKTVKKKTSAKIAEKPSQKVKKEVKSKPAKEKKPPKEHKQPKEIPFASEETSKPTPAVATEEKKVPVKVDEVKGQEIFSKTLECELPITIKDLSIKMQCKVNDLIKDLMGMGYFVTINKNIDKEIVEKICNKYDFTLKKPPTMEEQLISEYHPEVKDYSSDNKLRAPVITMMGHVDHGKTSLLDFIRQSRVVQKEKGGITQHIGAYQAELERGLVTFLDTPGHEAFTRMRARGAQITDVVVLVVAADDGIMPQTKEAIDHAKAAGAPIVVAINKCDLQSADIDKVYQGLAEVDLTPEAWGGKTVTVEVSAKTGQGVNDLLDMLLLEAELLELKANPHAHARGVIIESRLSKGKGALATVLVKNGTLRQRDIVICDLYWGRVKGMISHKGESVGEAFPSTPVEIIGLSGVPEAGEEFFVVKDEKKAKVLGDLKLAKKKKEALFSHDKVTLENLFEKISEEEIKELKIVIKGDVQGSIEAFINSLGKLPQDRIRVNIIHRGVGAITETDVMLAAASNAIVVGFHVKKLPGVDEIIEREGVDVRLYSIIYEGVNDLRAALEGMLEPELKESVVGKAEVRAVFKLSKSSGVIAGSYVIKGKIRRNAEAKIYRAGEMIYKDKIDSLKRFKDDAREVAEGYECGIKLTGHDDLKEGDVIEVIQIEKILRRLQN